MLWSVEPMKHMSGNVWMHPIYEAKSLLKAPTDLGEEVLAVVASITCAHHTSAILLQSGGS